MPAVSGRVAAANQVPNNRYDFAPNRLSNLYAWFRSDLGISLNGTTVSAWADQSGNQKHLIQSTASKQPTYSSSDTQYNNYPSLSFDGTNDVMSGTSFVYGPFTIFLVCKILAGTGLYLYVTGSGLTSDYFWADINDSTYIDRGGASTRSRLNISSNWGVGTTPKTYTHTMDGTHIGHKIYLNGSVQTTSDISTNDPGTSTVSRTFNLFGDDSSLFTHGTIAELVIFSSSLSGANRQAIEKYFQLRYVHY